MIEKLKNMTANLNVDYFDIRYETKHVDRVVMTKRRSHLCPHVRICTKAY